jgi:hypothetical protein
VTDSITLPRPAAEAMRDMLAAKGLTFGVLDAALAETVPWERCAQLLAEMAEYRDTPDAVHNADQTAANYLEYFDKFGIDLRDERRLFDLFVTLSFLSRLATFGVEQGTWPQHDADVVLVLLRGIAAVLAVLAPAVETR